MGNEGQKICGDLPETTAFKSYAAKQERRSQYANYSDLPAVSFLRLTHSEASEGYPTIVNNIQPCPKLCLPMPLAYVGARTDSTSYTATREAWPISAHAHWRSRQDMLYLRRGFSTLVLLVKVRSRSPCNRKIRHNSAILQPKHDIQSATCSSARIGSAGAVHIYVRRTLTKLPVCPI